MGCKPQGINRADVTSQDPSEQIHRCRPKWYFTRREIEENSPSRRDGIDSRKEKQLRSLYCAFVLDLGMKLRVPQATIATAMMFCHRFYLHQSHAKNDWQTIATVSMFLAGKVEETPRLLADVIVVAYELLNKRDPSATQRIKQTIVYEKQKKLILIGERLLMATMAFDFNLEHPYKPLVAAIKKLEITHKDVTQVAWNFVNDWLRTPLCLQYKPHYIAAGSLYLAAKFCKVKLPSERGKVWWLEFDVSPNQLEEVIKQMLSLLEDNKKPQMPSSQKKAIQAAVVKRTIAGSPESCVLSGSERTGKSIEGIEQKAGVGETSRQSSDVCARSSQTLPSQDFGSVRNGEESQCQTSDCGSSRSVVEDGSRTDEGEVQLRSEGSHLTAACQIVSDCGGSSRSDVEDGSRTDEGEVQPRLEGSHLMADCQIVSDCGGSSRIAVEYSSRNAEGEVQPRSEGSHLMATCQIVSDCGGSSRIAVEDGRTDEGEVQPRLEGSLRTTACEIVSDCGESSKIDDDSGGLSKIDKDRIKEALRKRKYEKTANKKVVRTLDEKDADSWIEEELENGIELGSEAPRKRKYEKTATKKVVKKLNDDKDTDSWIEEELENGIVLGSGSAEKRQKL